MPATPSHRPRRSLWWLVALFLAVLNAPLVAQIPGLPPGVRPTPDQVRALLGDWWEALGAEIALRKGSTQEALARAREVAASSRAQGLLVSLGLAERVAGEALDAAGGDAAEVDRHMEESLAAYQRGGLALDVARTRLAWGLVLQRRGEDVKALALLGLALDQLRVSGCAYALAEAERLWDAS